MARHSIIGAALTALLALPATAGGTLEGRLVTMNTLLYDDPAAPLMESRGRTVKVGAGVEFGMGPEGAQNGFDVVPVQVEILPSRIEISYGAESGSFWPARFNGYVLRFTTDCALFAKVSVDRTGTTMALDDSDIRVTTDALFINVEGLSYGPGQRMALDFEVSDCTLS